VAIPAFHNPGYAFARQGGALTAEGLAAVASGGIADPHSVAGAAAVVVVVNSAFHGVPRISMAHADNIILAAPYCQFIASNHAPQHTGFWTCK
jgi:hypothetical protein